MAQVTRHKTLPELPMTFLRRPHNMWVAGAVEGENRYFAVRIETPSFIVEVDDPTVLEDEAGKIVNQFLSTMHSFGFRLP